MHFYHVFSHDVLQAYYRQGVALQCLGKHSDALAAFANGLTQDPKSLQLLAGLIEAAMKSPLKGIIHTKDDNDDYVTFKLQHRHSMALLLPLQEPWSPHIGNFR